MKNHPGYYFLIFILCCFLTSCITGKYSHYPRVKIEPQVQLIAESKTLLSCSEIESLPSNKSETKQEQSLTEVKKEFPPIISHQSSQSKISTPSTHFELSPGRKLRKINKVERVGDAGDAGDDFLMLFLFLIVGLPATLLVIIGFILGMTGGMVGFWICWVLGMIGIILSCIGSIAILADADGDAWAIINHIFYMLMFCMAIAFILIVLLI